MKNSFICWLVGLTACIGGAEWNTPARAQVSGIDLKNISKEISPNQDFFRYINEEWLKNTPIPEDQSDWGSFTMLDIETKDAIRKLIEKASQQPNPTSIGRQVGSFYRSYMDRTTRNRLGIEPIRPMLKTIEGIQSKSDWMAVAGQLGRKGIPSLFGVYIDADAKLSDQYAIYVNQDGTSLPDRDYYLDEKFSKPLAEYRKYVQSMLVELGWKNAESISQRVVDLEVECAKVQWDKVKLQDPNAQYNKMPASDFAKMIPTMDLDAYTRASGLASNTDLIVGQPSFFKSLSELFEKTDLEVLKATLAFQTFNTFAPTLSESIEKKHFAFFETVLSGVEEQEPLERRAVNACNALLTMPVGQLYVEQYYTERAREKMDVLIKNLLKAFEVRIKQLEWMGEGTKKEALQKLSLFNPKIGMPRKWKDYSSVTVEPTDLVGNVTRLAEFEHNYALNKIGKTVDRDEWFMGPQTVNAYYNPTMNEIVFPAAILQPPFFNLDADDAVNYGGIGAVIGHEISHGFDNQGSQFDGKGNLRNWWTENDEAEFKKRTKQLSEQYDLFEPIPGMKVNGNFTLGENIGDLGGLSVAYTAYKISLDGKKSPVIDNLTGEQRFFSGWAQVWRRKYREPELKRRLANDPHSPSQYRCNGIVSNMDAFYEAFDVKPGAPMYVAPEKRVRIW